ncbi:MAG: type II toxin-antitoxin system ParD family antitoxin [Caulobacter sp.]|nr:type II toxin-antitoxin system ParD family antitoxin [Caulobacter sp.]
MAKIDKISVALPTEMVDGVREAVESGEYATVSEVIRDALRDWKIKRRLSGMEIEELRRLVREGMESGPGRPAEAVFARLTAKYATMADQTK